MFIYTIYPVSNIPRQNMLTYFSKEVVTPGTLVEIMYGKNKLFGIVISSEPLKNVKEVIRTQEFSLRKITRVIKEQTIDPKLLKKIEEYTSHTYTKIGNIITDIFPLWFWRQDAPQIHTHTGELPNQNRSVKKKTSIQYIEGTFTDRWDKYKKTITTHDTIWICVPHVLALKKIHALLKKDTAYSDYSIYTFYGTLSEKKQINSYHDMPTKKKYIILSTPYYFGVFYQSAGLIIYENYGDDAYTIGQPHEYDVIELFNTIPTKDTERIYGGTLIPIPTPVLPHTNRTLTYTGFTKENARYNHLFVNEHIVAQFQSDLLDNKKILLVTQYKDTNIKIVCNDCKQTVTCPTCKLALYTVVKKNDVYFHCRFCKKSYPSKTRCVHCQSWNLTALGINTKTIKESLASLFPTAHHVTVTSLSDCEKFTDKEFDSVYVISIDGLMHNPHFKTEERILRTLLKLEEIGTRLFVQTSFPFPNILSMLKNVSLDTWKNQEIQYRQKNQYPPYGTLYTVTARTRKDQSMLDTLEKHCIQQAIPVVSNPYRITLFVGTTDAKRIETLLAPYTQSQLLIKKES